MLEEESDNNNSDNALTLNLHAYTYEASPCSSKELYIDSGAENNGESLILQSRKRKRSEEEIEDGESDDCSEEETDMDMPDVVHQMEAEIERQLDAKSKKTNLTVANVKNILKDVITNEHVLELVRRTMKQPESNFCINKVFTYAPKLTRAKTRELLNTFPAMAWPITPSKNISTSKCKVLIEQELPEDSSDEEYRPDEDDDDEHDDTENPVQDLDNENKELEEEGEQVESDDVDSVDDADEDDDEDDEEEEEDDEDDDDEEEEHASGDTVDLPKFKESDPKFSKTEIQVQGDEDDDEDRLVICDNEGEDNDSDYTPIEKYTEDNQNSTKNMFINHTDTQTQWLEKVVKATENDMISLPDFSESNATNEENICQRTRSKLSLSDTPLEAIESAFMPPDITTDMYDSECDDEDWKNFLKGFTQPMKDSTQDADDDEEIDPEYNIMAEEEDADDKEELREDRGVMVSRKEVNDLMAELFEYIGMLDSDDCEVASRSKSNDDKICETFEQKNNSDELKDIADHIAGVLEEHTIRSTSKSNDDKICETFEQKNNSDELNDIADHIAGVLEEHTEGSLQKSAVSYEDHQTNPINPNLFCTPNHIFNNRIVNEDIFSSKTEGFSDSSHIVEHSMSQEQLLLFKQQMRQYVQLRTQHFLLSYLHPLFHMYSMDCKQNLLLLKNLANSNKDSAYNADNLDGAIDLIKHWELTHSSEHSKKVYMDFFDKEIEIQNVMKRRKQFHRGEFPPEFLETVSNSNVFIYPLLLPLNPFRSDSPSVTRFFRSEDNLIALGLEHFTKYAQKNPKVMGKSTLPKFVPMIVEHFLPARRPSSVHTRILDCSKVDNNPIQYFLQKKCAPKTTHYVIPRLGAWLPPCKQPLDLLPFVWRNYVIERQRNKNGSGNTN